MTHAFQLPSASAFRAVKWLVGAYAIVSAAAVAAIILFAAVDPALVSPPAEVRAGIVAATSLLTFVFASRAARGDPRALLRLRIIVAVILVAVVGVLLFVPLPAWMIVEQAACGILLAATAAVIFRPRSSRHDQPAPSE